MSYAATCAGVAAVFLPPYVLSAFAAKRSSFYRLEATPTKHSRFPMLDGLRGYLALGVMLHHVSCNYSYYARGVWEPAFSRLFAMIGSVAVGQFFLITGFLFWGKAIDKKLKIRPFLVSRFFRLGPLYLLSMFFLFLVICIETHFTPAVSVWENLTDLGIFLSLGILRPDILNGVHTLRFNAGVPWTLQYEWIFYFTLPLLAFFATPRRFIVIILLSFGLYFIRIPQFPELRQFCWLFTAGMFAAHLVRWKPAIPMLRSRAAAVGMIAIALGAIVLFPHAYIYARVFPLLSLLVFVPVVYGNAFFGLLATDSSRILGTISYSIYLMHGFFLFATSIIIQHTVGMANISFPLYWTAIGGASFSAVGACLVTYRFVEHPFLRSSSASSASGAKRSSGVAAEEAVLGAAN